MKNFIQKNRKILFLMADAILISVAVYFAFLLRFDGEIPNQYFSQGTLVSFIFLVLIFSLPIFYYFG